jgi:hypothetical protein
VVNGQVVGWKFITDVLALFLVKANTDKDLITELIVKRAMLS